MTADVDIILAAHGAGPGSPANERVRSLASRLESLVTGARVTAAFRLGKPTHHEAIEGAARRHRVVVPLFASDGHYAAVLRADVERSSGEYGRSIVLPPIGLHPKLAAALVERVRSTFRERRLGVDRTHVLVVGHGTPRHSASGDSTRALVRQIAASTGLAAHAVFLDEAPSIDDVIGSLPSDVQWVVVPLLLGGGEHARVHVPARVAAAAERRGVPAEAIVVLDPMGDHPLFLELIAESVNNALGTGTTLLAGARRSRLSQVQVELVAERLAAHAIALTPITIDTLGDRDTRTPIGNLGVEDPFTREIDDALRDGRIDIAVHSAKDLPLREEPDVVNAAYLPRAAADDVLVTRAGTGLADLPEGARIGTSCERRAAQLRRLRRDVTPVPVRGDVPARVAAVDRGDVDAVVLAAAGLERLELHDRVAQRFSLTTFLPAPAQGAIAVRCRADSLVASTMRRIDDHATRLAVEAELAFARAASGDARVAAAHAIVEGDTISLHARLIDPVTLDARDVRTQGCDPRVVGAAAARALQ